MERCRAGSSFHGSLPQRQTTTPFTSLPPKSRLKEPPASPYLRPAAGAVILDSRGSRRNDDMEIGIFDAESYFSRGNHEVKFERLHLSARRRQSAEGYSRHSPVGSCCSMASWNNQSGLLSDPPASVGAVRVLILKELGKSQSFNCRCLFPRKWLCSGEKSVEVEEKFCGVKSPSRPDLNLSSNFDAKRPSFRTVEASLSRISERATTEEIENKFAAEETIKAKVTPRDASPNPSFCSSSSRFSLNRPFLPEVGRHTVNSEILLGDSGRFSFPILNPPTFNLVEEPPRASPEVFPPKKAPAVVFPISDDKDRRLCTYSAMTTPSPDDDEASDASSDLFELESLCAEMRYRRCDSFHTHDRLRCEVAPPSIAPSIEQSVTTAEWFDGESHANFPRSTSNCRKQRVAKAKDKRRKSVSIMDCRSEKAVCVAPTQIEWKLSRQSGRVRRAEFVSALKTNCGTNSCITNVG